MKYTSVEGMGSIGSALIPAATDDGHEDVGLARSDIKFSGSVMINRPVGEVFDYVSDMQNLPKYAPIVLASEKTTEGPIGVGTEFQLQQQLPGLRGDLTMTFSEYDPPHRFLFQETRFGPTAETAEFLFEELDDSTRVTIQGDPNPQGLLRLLGPVFNRFASRIWNGNLASLKQELEAPN